MTSTARLAIPIVAVALLALSAVWLVRVVGGPSPAPPPLDGSSDVACAGPAVTVARRIGDIPAVQSAVRVSPCLHHRAESTEQAIAAADEVLRRLRGSQILGALDRVVIVGSISVGRRSVCALASPESRCVLLASGGRDGGGYLKQRLAESFCSEVLRLACASGVGSLGSLEGPPWGGYDEEVLPDVVVDWERTWTDVDHEAGFLSRHARRSLLRDVLSVAAASVVRPEDLHAVCRASPVIRAKREQVERCLAAMEVPMQVVGIDDFPR